MEKENLTVEEFMRVMRTPKLGFAIFRRTNPETGVVETQYCRDAEGNVVTYTDPTTGEVKPLPKVLVKDTAQNIIAFCSAEVGKKKILGGKATEGSYFHASYNPDGTIGYQLRKAGSSEFSLGEE